MKKPERPPIDVSIRIGTPSEQLQEERRVATHAFAEDLRTKGLSVEVDEVSYIRSRRGVTPVEWTFIGMAATKTLDLVVDGAKELLRRRRAARIEAGVASQHLGFVIYGPDGKILRQWSTGDDRN